MTDQQPGKVNFETLFLSLHLVVFVRINRYFLFAFYQEELFRFLEDLRSVVKSYWKINRLTPTLVE